MAHKVDKTTQLILTQKITHFFNSLDAYTVVEQHKEYNKTKSLGYGASTLANIQHGHSVSRKTIIIVMGKLGLVYDKQYFLNHGIIKHVENEAPKDKVCDGCKGCTYYQHEYHNCQGQEKICHEYSKFGK